jgi:hypothetical protein
MFVRRIGEMLEARLREPHRFIQVLAGPRQVGKHEPNFLRARFLFLPP